MNLQFTEYITPLEIFDKAYNVISFQNRLHENYCLNALREFVKIDKNIDVDEFSIIDVEEKKLLAKNVLYLPWKYDSFEEDANVRKILFSKMKHRLEQDTLLYEKSLKINHMLETFFYEVSSEMIVDNFKIEFDIEQMTIESMAKMTKSHFLSMDESFSESIFKEKKAYLEFMLNTGSYQLLIVEMPETMMNNVEKKLFTNYLMGLQSQVTVLVLTRDVEYLSCQKNLECIHCINMRGEKYPLLKIINEGKLFTTNVNSLRERVLFRILNRENKRYSISEQKLIDDLLAINE